VTAIAGFEANNTNNGLLIFLETTQKIGKECVALLSHTISDIGGWKEEPKPEPTPKAKAKEERKNE
jgi:hypothetical protein